MKKIFCIAVLMLAFVGCAEVPEEYSDDLCDFHEFTIIESWRSGNKWYLDGIQENKFKRLKVRHEIMLHLKRQYSEGDTIFCNKIEIDLIPEIK